MILFFTKTFSTPNFLLQIPFFFLYLTVDVYIGECVFLSAIYWLCNAVLCLFMFCFFISLVEYSFM